MFLAHYIPGSLVIDSASRGHHLIIEMNTQVYNDVTGLEICGILVANATMFSHLLLFYYSHVVANIRNSPKFMVLLI